MPSSEYRLPAPPAGAAELTLLRWLKRPGDALAPGEPLVIVANERLELALPADAAGVLAEQLCPAGATVAAGALIATLTTLAPEATAPALARPRAATPVAWRIAAQRGLDPLALPGSGVAGRVTKADVLAALARRAPAGDRPPPTIALPPAGAAPHVITAVEIDLCGVAAARARLGADPRWRGLPLPDSLWVLAAVADALPRHPALNGSWHEDGILIRRRVDLALAEVGWGALVLGAQDLNLRGLARALAARPAPAGAGSAFAVVQHPPGVWCGLPEIRPGQSAALAIGAPRDVPAVLAEPGGERVAVRRRCMLALAYDARVIDQHRADAFLRDIKGWVERADKRYLV